MRRTLLFATTFALVATTACGTRLPDSAFGGSGADGAVASAGVGRTDAAGGTASAGGQAAGDDVDLSDLGGSGDRAAAGTPEDAATAGASPSGDPQGTTTGSAPAGDAGTDPAAPGGTQPGGDAGRQGQGQSGGAQENQASDVGVTPSTIKVGNIVSKGGALGPNQFTPSYYGANAYFAYINATQGGIHGREVEFVTCDDKENKDENVACAQRLVEQEEVFALVANNTRAYAGAKYVSEHGVPDVGGQPIGTEYYTYPNLFGILGGPYERDGEVGDHGTMYWYAGLQGWYAQHQGITKAAVFYYNIPISKQTGQIYAKSLQRYGVETIEFEINPAYPNFGSHVETMRSEGVDAIFDAMDANANRNLCDAMAQRNFGVKVKASTIAGWTRSVADQYPEICRQSMWVSGTSRPTSDRDDPEVALFNEVMHRVYDGRFDATMHQWAFEGWLAAKLFAQAVEAQGATPTRAATIEHFRRVDDHGLGQWLARDQVWKPYDWANPPTSRCVVFAKWNEQAHDFVAANELTDCNVPGEWLAYEAIA